VPLRAGLDPKENTLMIMAMIVSMVVFLHRGEIWCYGSSGSRHCSGQEVAAGRSHSTYPLQVAKQRSPGGKAPAYVIIVAVSSKLRKASLPAGKGLRATCKPLYLQFLSHFASSTMSRMVMYVGSDTFRCGS
jgi:hypothetical protein